jgi:hypothetical protein
MPRLMLSLDVSDGKGIVRTDQSNPNEKKVSPI